MSCLMTLLCYRNIYLPVEFPRAIREKILAKEEITSVFLPFFPHMLQGISHSDLSSVSSKLLLGCLVFMDNCVGSIKQQGLQFFLIDTLARLKTRREQAARYHKYVVKYRSFKYIIPYQFVLLTSHLQYSVAVL